MEFFLVLPWRSLLLPKEMLGTDQLSPVLLVAAKSQHMQYKCKMNLKGILHATMVEREHEYEFDQKGNYKFRNDVN